MKKLGRSGVLRVLGVLSVSAVAGGATATLGCTHRIIEDVVQGDGGATLPGAKPGAGTSSSGHGGSSSGQSSTSSSSSGSSGSSGSSTSSSSSGSSGASTSSSGGPATCPTTSVAATALPWKAPTPLQPNRCTAANVTSMDAWLTANPSSTNAQFEAYVGSLGTACHDCIFTDANAATWGPAPMSAGTLVTPNIGACFALVSGKVGCGKAVQDEFDCESVACADCADQTAFTTCRTQVQTGACAPYASAISSACAGVSPNVDNVCGSFLQSVTAQCVASPDAGI